MLCMEHRENCLSVCYGFKLTKPLKSLRFICLPWTTLWCEQIVMFDVSKNIEVSVNCDDKNCVTCHHTYPYEIKPKCWEFSLFVQWMFPPCYCDKCSPRGEEGGCGRVIFQWFSSNFSVQSGGAKTARSVFQNCTSTSAFVKSAFFKTVFFKGVLLKCVSVKNIFC